MKNKILLIVLIMLGMTNINQNIYAQCGQAGNGTNGGIHCMYPDSLHNCLYVGGGFHTSGTDSMNHVCYWNDTTYLPMNMMGHNGCDDSVWCFTMFNGNLYVGGNFMQAGGITCNYIARWDGSSWYTVGNGFNHPVHALAVYNNALYAGGEFTASGTTTINYIGKWDGSQWSQVDAGTNDDVDVMCVWNSALYIGGDFTSAGSLTANHICKWDGINFSAVGSGFTTGMGGQCMIHSLCAYNGNLFAGGMFEHAGSIDMHNMAMWNGSAWSSIGDIDGAMMGDNSVNAMCVYDGHLFIGGNFGSCGSTSSNNLGMWDGFNWSNIGTGMNGMIHSLAIYHNNLYIGGTFSNATGTSVNNIAKYSANTGIQPIQKNSNFFNVYPNPAKENIQVSWINEKPSEVTLRITDLAGRILFEENQGISGVGLYQETIPVNNISAGIYIITVNSNEIRFTAKFEVNR